MKEENKDIDSIFRVALDNHQMPASDMFWEKLNTDLDSIQQAKKGRKRIVLLLLLFLFFLLTGGYFILDHYYFNSPPKVLSNSELPGLPFEESKEKIIDQVNTPIANSNPEVSKNEDPENEVSRGVKEDEKKVKDKAYTDSSESNTKTKSITRKNASSIPSSLEKANIKKSGDNTQYKKDTSTSKITKKPVINSSTKTKGKKPVSRKKFNPISTKPKVFVENTTRENPVIRTDSTKNINGRESNLNPVTVSVEDKKLNTPEKADTINANILASSKKQESKVDSTAKAEDKPIAEADKKPDPISSAVKDSVNKDEKPIGRFAIEVFGAPLYTRNYLVDNTPNNSIDDPQAYSERETSKFSFSTGLALRYNFNDRYSISVGGYYSTIAYSVALSTIYAKIGTGDKPHFQYLTSWGTIEIPDQPGYVINEGDSIKFNTTCEQFIRFINIPVIGRITFPGSRFSWFIDAGLSFNFRTDEVAVVKFGNEEYVYENDRIGIKNSNHYAILGVGGSYKLSRRTSIFLEPVIRVSLSSITENIPVKTYPNSFGLNLGLSFKL